MSVSKNNAILLVSGIPAGAAQTSRECAPATQTKAEEWKLGY